MKQIFILTNFSQYLGSYSPIIVVADQIRMLKKGGYEPVLITAQGWEPPENTIYASTTTLKMIPAHVYNEPKEFSEVDIEEVNTLEEQLNEFIPDNSVVITHDLIFLPDYVKHNVAARRVAEAKPGIQWIHWIHSATSPHKLIEERSMYGEKYKELLSSRFPNSIIAFPNAGDIPRVAVNFGYEEDQIFEVPHPTDPVEFLHPIIQRLWDEKELYDADVIMSYPLRLDRGKQAEVNVRVAAGLKQIGLRPRLVFFDFQSTGDDKLVYRQELKDLAIDLNVQDEIIFMSEFDESLQLETDRKMVREFFQLTDIFIMPSKSETYSLVAQEAMLAKNLTILNHHFLPMRSIYKHHALYRMFSAGISPEGTDGETQVNYDNIDDYMRSIAMNIKYYITNNKVLSGFVFVRRDRNPDAVFRDFLEPLFYRNNGE